MWGLSAFTSLEDVKVGGGIKRHSLDDPYLSVDACVDSPVEAEPMCAETTWRELQSLDLVGRDANTISAPTTTMTTTTTTTPPPHVVCQVIGCDLDAATPTEAGGGLMRELGESICCARLQRGADLGLGLGPPHIEALWVQKNTLVHKLNDALLACAREVQDNDRGTLVSRGSRRSLEGDRLVVFSF